MSIDLSWTAIENPDTIRISTTHALPLSNLSTRVQWNDGGLVTVNGKVIGTIVHHTSIVIASAKVVNGLAFSFLVEVVGKFYTVKENGKSKSDIKDGK